MNLGMIAVFLVNHHCNRFYSYQKMRTFPDRRLYCWRCIFYTDRIFCPNGLQILENVMSSEAYLILVCGLFGSIIALLTASKGNYGFSKLVSRLCNTERKTLIQR